MPAQELLVAGQRQHYRRGVYHSGTGERENACFVCFAGELWRMGWYTFWTRKKTGLNYHTGVYGSYGMHVEQMALLISLKNHVHAEVAAVATVSPGGGPVVASPASATTSVTNGFDSKSDDRPTRMLAANEHNSMSPATGFFMADVTSPKKLTEVITQTPDPFRDGETAGDSGNNNNNMSTRNTQISPYKRPLNHPLLLSDLGDSEEDALLEGARDKLSSFPHRMWYEVPAPPQYTEQALQNREMALRVSQEGPADGWVQLTSSKGVQVWQKKMGDGKPNMVRGVLTDVPCSPGYFLSRSGSADRPNWDPMCAKGHLVEVIDDYCTVSYERYHPIFPTSARDFVVLNSVVKRPDGSYLRSAVSVEHPDCPETSGVVRANLLFACFLVTPNAVTGNCDVQYTLYVDLKGSIPAWIVARVATDQPLSLAGLREYIMKNEEAGEALRVDPMAVRGDMPSCCCYCRFFFSFFLLGSFRENQNHQGSSSNLCSNSSCS